MINKAPESTDKEIGSRVRMRRLMLGITQGELGKALGITFQQIQKYEKGTNRIPAGRLQDLAYVLQVPISFFFDEGPTAPLPAHVSKFLGSADGLALARAFTSIKNAKVRRRITDLIVNIAEVLPSTIAIDNAANR